MPVVKGGVWTNIEDEILKASVSKYGLNQWARVSSLLARKTPKQCKARWSEWLDPSIRKIEWSKEEDEKLLHLAKLMPTQWRTIAPIVGRTATQCLERYQKLLDEAEAKENDELGLGGPDGGETQAPSADDVRRLRPGELDPDPESKPARPDTIDLDEDEKEMLSEARARLANTQGKKAKRKARERQLEDSRRMALLQKRRELKNAGINIKITNRKKGQMDYNADIPFEKKAAPGFYDTQEEGVRNEKQREAFDPRKQQLANKRKSDQQLEDADPKRRKGEKDKPSASFAAAAKAGQMQKLREAEQSNKRRPLNLPAPQVDEAELEDIVKMGVAGEQANRNAGDIGDDTARGLSSNYSNMVGSTPIRTPRAPPQEDHIANEIRNIRAMTETQSSLLGGENTPLHEGSSSTGFDGVTPRNHVVSTPNPMATPLRQGGHIGVGATPARNGAMSSATPMRTPRDGFALNQDGSRQLVSATPGDLRNAEDLRKSQLKAQFAALPAPKELDFELELPEETVEGGEAIELSQEDAAERDAKNKALQEARDKLEFSRRTQVLQRHLPRPTSVDADAILKDASSLSDPIDMMIAQEKALLIVNDSFKFPLNPRAKTQGSAKPLQVISDEHLSLARFEIAKEMNQTRTDGDAGKALSAAYASLQGTSADVLGLAEYGAGDTGKYQVISQAFDDVQVLIKAEADKGKALESKLSLHLGGYQKRAKTLRQKIGEAAEALEQEEIKLDTFRNLQVAEDAALTRRTDSLKAEVEEVTKREREGQERYRKALLELEDAKGQAVTNGVSH